MSEEPQIIEVEECIPEYLQTEISSLETDLLNMDRAFTRADDRRERLLAKIEKVVDEMDISLGGDPEKLEAQSKMVDTYAKLLKDSEDNHYKRTSLKLRKKQDDHVMDVQSVVAGVLRTIDVREVTTMPYIPLTQQEKENFINSQFDSRGCVVVNKTELEHDHTSAHALSTTLREEAETAFLRREEHRKI